jgi:hypothetical protein
MECLGFRFHSRLAPTIVPVKNLFWAATLFEIKEMVFEGHKIAFNEADHTMEIARPPGRRRFCESEDRILEELVRELGTSSWEQIATHLPHRSARQCRERWKHHLSSGQRECPWTPDEDRLVWEKVDEIGPKWTQIASLLPGRSDYQTKARWLTLFGRRRQDCFRDASGSRKLPSHRRRSEVESDGGKPELCPVRDSLWDHFNERPAEEDFALFLQW